jgi:hypothetical protein
VTYGGGPEKGFVYFTNPRKSGWCKWLRNWFTQPVYTRVDEGQVVFLVNADGSEQIAVLPSNWERTVDLDELTETVIIADDAFRQEIAGS